MSKKLVKKSTSKKPQKINQDIVVSDKTPDKVKENYKKSKDLHRPDYKMVVKQQLSTTNMLVLLAIYTVGVVFVTISFVKDSCS